MAEVVFYRRRRIVNPLIITQLITSGYGVFTPNINSYCRANQDDKGGKRQISWLGGAQGVACSPLRKGEGTADK